MKINKSKDDKKKEVLILYLTKMKENNILKIHKDDNLGIIRDYFYFKFNLIERCAYKLIEFRFN